VLKSIFGQWRITHPQNAISPVFSLTGATFVFSEEGILGFWQLMEIHHLDRSLLFG